MPAAASIKSAAKASRARSKTRQKRAAAPFDADDLYGEVTSASPYARLDRDTFDKVVEFEDIDCRAAQGLETAGLLD